MVLGWNSCPVKHC